MKHCTVGSVIKALYSTLWHHWRMLGGVMLLLSAVFGVSFWMYVFLFIDNSNLISTLTEWQILAVILIPIGFVYLFVMYSTVTVINFLNGYENTQAARSFGDILYAGWQSFLSVWSVIGLLVVYAVFQDRFEALIPHVEILTQVLFGVIDVYIVLAIFTAVLEGKKGISAFTASWELIAGRWWKTLGHRLLIGMFDVVSFFLFMGVLLVVSGISFGVDSEYGFVVFMVESLMFLYQTWWMLVLSMIVVAFNVLVSDLYMYHYYILLKKDKAAGHVTDFKTIS